jgi:hypothetical protein
MPTDTADDADTVASIARAVPGVAGLHPGPFGEVATHLPGRRVAGVRIDDERIEVHLVLAADAHIRDTAAAVRQAVSTAFGGRRVDVSVNDIATGPRPVPSNPNPTSGDRS